VEPPVPPSASVTAQTWTPRTTGRRTRRLAAIPAVLAAVVMLALGGPRLVGVILAAPGEPVLRRLQDQQPVAAADLRTLIEAQEAARPWLADGRIRTDLGLAWLLLSETQAQDAPDEAAAAMQKAAVALRDGLARAPANPYAWSRLAYAEALIEGWTPAAVAALRLALITAPYEPRLLWSRLQMTFLAWPRLSAEDRDLVFQQVRWAWQANPAELAKLAVRSKQVNVVRAALLRTPEEALTFERLVAEQH